MNVQLIPVTTRSVFFLKQNTTASFTVSLDVSQLPSASIVGYNFDFRAKRTLTQNGYDLFFPTGSVAILAMDFQTINISFLPSDTALLVPGDYFWEMRLLNPSQSIDTRTPYSLYGEIFLLQSL